ncbi:MAG: addiction module toxin, HicA family [Candidatus Latescibacteria bacterium 4484_107]|nr:MAG: addiction module toxin, HicA family [Candidatus Latescibacteria bacterium 4484_107]
MKRQAFISQLLKEGCVLLRHGSRHDIYLNPSTGLKQPVPRHREIDDNLLKHIRK